MTEAATHPCQEGYVSLEGPNIAPGWVGQAACRGVEQAIFLGKIGKKRPDKAVCADCPVRESCLMDSLGRVYHKTQKPRAELSGDEITDVGKAIRRLVTDESKTVPKSSMEIYAFKQAFYPSDERAIPVVTEYLSWRERTLALHKEGRSDEVRPWPTEAAIEIRNSIT